MYWKQGAHVLNYPEERSDPQHGMPITRWRKTCRGHFSSARTGLGRAFFWSGLPRLGDKDIQRATDDLLRAIEIEDGA